MSNDYNAEHDPAWVGSAGVWRLKDEFETKENPLADDSDVVKDALASIFTLGSIIGYCSGPAGAPIAAALSAGAGILTALKKPENDNELATLLGSIQTMQRNDKVNKQVAAVEAYWGWLKIHKDILESTKITKAQSLKSILQTLDNNWTDPSHELFLSTISHHSDNNWARPASRLAASTSVSCLISAHSIRCRIYAWLALDAKARNKTEDYNQHLSSFEDACQIMQNTADQKRSEMKKLIEEATEQRVALIKGPTFDWKNRLWPQGYDYQGRLNQHKAGTPNPLWFVEDTHTGKYGTWDGLSWLPHAFMNKWIINRETVAPEDATNAAFHVKVRLRQHCGLSANPTRVIMESWNAACKEAKTYIYPRMEDKHKPEKLRDEHVEEIHPWLRDAETVSWAYKLRTSEGTSDLSEWTDDYTIPSSGPISLPVLKMHDFGFRIASDRIVYHRKIVRGSKAKEGYGDLVQSRVVDGNVFVDSMPDI